MSVQNPRDCRPSATITSALSIARPRRRLEGQHFIGEYRFSEGHDDRLPAFAEELVSGKVVLIATSGNTGSALAAKRATATIPIVFITGGDPIAAGLVDNLAHPGGNITGVTLIAGELNRKRLEFLRELLQSGKSIVVMVNSGQRACARHRRGPGAGGAGDRFAYTDRLGPKCLRIRPCFCFGAKSGRRGADHRRRSLHEQPPAAC
jgi:hypothetical protein